MVQNNRHPGLHAGALHLHRPLPPSAKLSPVLQASPWNALSPQKLKLISPVWHSGGAAASARYQCKTFSVKRLNSTTRWPDLLVLLGEKLQMWWTCAFDLHRCTKAEIRCKLLPMYTQLKVNVSGKPVRDQGLIWLNRGQIKRGYQVFLRFRFV